MGKQMNEFLDILDEFGLEIISRTNNEHDGKRGLQIQDWIDRHKSDIDNFVIIDDEVSDILPFGFDGKVVQTEFYGNGLQMEHAEKAIQILNGGIK